MSLLGKIVETATLGMVQEVDEEEVPQTDPEVGNPTDSSVARPAVRRPTGSIPGSTSMRTTSGSDINKASADSAREYLERVMQTTPAKFQEFLGKKQEYVELLQDSGADPAKVESTAIAKAVKATKLASADVAQATQKAKQALDSLIGDFESELAESRQEKVTEPTKALEATESQITELQKKINDLEAGIEPARAQIAQAEAQLTSAQTIFNGSCAIVKAELEKNEAAILAATRKS